MSLHGVRGDGAAENLFLKVLSEFVLRAADNRRFAGAGFWIAFLVEAESSGLPILGFRIGDQCLDVRVSELSVGIERPSYGDIRVGTISL